MINGKLLILTSTLSLFASTQAFALQGDKQQVAHSAMHKHHVAKSANAAKASDADRDAGMYVVKPGNEPEYFGHASGSDGAMPQE